MFHRFAALSLTLAASTALAAPSLLQAATDTPVPQTLSLTASAPEAPMARLDFGLLYASGAAATLVATPAALGLSVWAGTWSNNIIGALLPAVLITALVPPLVSTLVQAWEGRHQSGAPMRRLLPWLAGSGVQLVLFVAAVLLNVNAGSFGGAAAFTVASAALVPLASGLVMRATAPPSRPQSSLPVALAQP